MPLIAALVVLAQTGQTAATPTPCIELPPDERVIDLAWQDSGSLVVVVAQTQGYAVRRLELATGDLLVISAPRSFTNVRPDSAQYTPEFYLAPNGSALAVLERAATPLVAHDLTVYRVGMDALVPVVLRQIPDAFWPEQVAWEESGSGLVMSARQYLFPDQPYSLGRLDLATGGFTGIALKANVDLIDELVYVPQRGAAAVRCRGYHGDYPAQAMIVLLDPHAGQERILHSRADEMSLHVLSSGQLLIVSGEPAGGSEWILGWDETALRRARCAVGESIAGLQASADGAWLGFIAGRDELELEGEGDTRYLVLQRSRDGRTLLTAEPCSRFVFSPAGTQVCAVSPEGDRLHFYVIPQ